MQGLIHEGQAPLAAGCLIPPRRRHGAFEKRDDAVVIDVCLETRFAVTAPTACRSIFRTYRP